MQVSFKKRFLKQLAKLPANYRSDIEQFAFSALPDAASLGETGKFEKMQGFECLYKARFGPYRVGAKLVSANHVELMVVLHRREVYRHSP